MPVGSMTYNPCTDLDKSESKIANFCSVHQSQETLDSFDQ
jgi:hypothetical protein